MGKGGAAAHDDEFHTGPGHGHIHAAQVLEESDLALLIGPYQGNDDDVTFLPLESVNGVDGDKAAERLEKAILLDALP